MSNEKAIAQLAPSDLAQIDYISNFYDAKIAQGVQPPELLNPAFWAHHGVKLKPYDEIRARSEDGSWMARLIVVDSSRTWARVKLLELYALGTADVSLSQAAEEEVRKQKDLYKVAFRGPHKWSVLRKSDNNIMQEHLAQRLDAEAWLDRHVREQLSAPAPEVAAAPA